MGKIAYKNLCWILITGLVFAADRSTKFLAVRHLIINQPYPIFPFFNLYLNYNPGAAFSFLSAAPGWQTWLFSLVAIVVSLAIILWLIKSPKQQKLIKIALALILGGILGNLYDRIIYTTVVDFLDFYIPNWKHWPTFNLADTAICCGVFLLIIEMFLRKGKDKYVKQRDS